MTAGTPSLAAGDLLGPFRIVEPLGSGGMGIVYRAHDTRLDRDVALKLLGDVAAEGEAACQRLLREARLASALNHPNICTIYEAGETGGRAWVAMELVEGRLLRDAIPAGGLDADTAARYALGIAEALAHAHARGVVHRDLKPTNIMVTPEGRIKVLDFGLARRLDPPSGASPLDTTITQAGWVVGTPNYLPPEVLLGAKADARSDLWSLGVVMHEMLSGGRPFDGDSVVAVSQAILNEPPRPLPPRTPPALRALVLRLLAKDPAKRVPDADTVVRELGSMLSPSGTRLLAAAAPSRSLWLGIVLGAVIVALGAVAFAHWVLFPPNSSGRIRSLAVLPLANLSADPAQQYFADGMTDELITQLAPIESLTVISRTSVMPYQNTRKPIRQIARELGVDAIVEGSVLRSGDRVRITAQLIDARHDRHLWAQSYERDLKDVIGIQREVAKAITDNIRLNLSPVQSARLAERPQVDPQAYELYLRSRYEWATLSDAGVRRSIEYARQAIARDPHDARYYAAVADGYLTLAQIVNTMPFAEALPNVKQYAAQALQIDPRSADAHASMATAVLWTEHDWRRAESFARRAAELNPGLSNAQLVLGVIIGSQGRLDEGLAHLRRAIELDPLSLINHYSYTWQLFESRRYEEALAEAARTLELEPRFQPMLILESWIDERLGRFDAAVDALARTPLWAGHPDRIERLRRGVASGGAHGFWQAQHEIMSMPFEGFRPSHAWDAYVFAGLGERDSAFVALGRALAAGEGDMVFVKVNPTLDTLHTDPRWAAMLTRIGLAP